MHRAAHLALVALLLAVPARRASAAEAGVKGAREKIASLRQELQGVEARLLVVEKQYAGAAEPAEAEELKRRYSDAEIQFLLNNYVDASVLLYDLIGTPSFHAGSDYIDAIYLLAESLYQQQNYLGARSYFREHLKARGRHFRDALARYLEISSRLNEFTGIDEFVQQARNADGSLPNDIAYAYGKWLFRRTDLPDAERLERARTVFTTVAQAREAFVPQSLYFLGVLAVQRGALPEAESWFKKVLAHPAADDREQGRWAGAGRSGPALLRAGPLRRRRRSLPGGRLQERAVRRSSVRECLGARAHGPAGRAGGVREGESGLREAAGGGGRFGARSRGAHPARAPAAQAGHPSG
jgi:tetratricopeptide (TPR) repeat protein